MLVFSACQKYLVEYYKDGLDMVHLNEAWFEETTFLDKLKVCHCKLLKKVWKSVFDQLFLPAPCKNQSMNGTIEKII